MNQELLEDIYLGNSRLADMIDGDPKKYEEYHEANQEALKAYEELKRKIPSEIQEEFEEFFELNGVSNAAANKDSFIGGARFGARLILELLYGDTIC